MKTIDPKLSEMIAQDAKELYFTCFFEPYLVNFIADISNITPQRVLFLQKMSVDQYKEYLQRKNGEAIDEMCQQIKNDVSFERAIEKGLCKLLSDFI